MNVSTAAAAQRRTDRARDPVAGGAHLLHDPLGADPLADPLAAHALGASPPALAAAGPVQRIGTRFTDDLANAKPSYLQELASLHAPGLWDYTDGGAFAVTHRGRKDAVGMDAATYSPAILKTIPRPGFLGLNTNHYDVSIALSSPTLAASLYGRDCGNAARYLMHFNQGQDLSAMDSFGAPVHATRGQAEKSSGLSADYNLVTQRPNLLPFQLPPGVKDANAKADIGEAYCIVSEPGADAYNFHYGCVAARRGDEILTVEGFATSSALTTPDWSFNVYDSQSTFHQVWEAGMTSSAPVIPGYPFTFVSRLV